MSTKTFLNMLQVLSYGKLSNLSIFGEGTGVVPVSTHPRAIAAMNLARTALFTRFRLKQRELSVLAKSDQTTYYLRPEYAFNSGVVGNDKYIVDDINEPFIGGLARIENVYGPDGCKYSIGDEVKPHSSVQFIGHDALVLNFPKTGDAYRIDYRAAPIEVELDYSVEADGDFELEIPDPYWTAFLSKVTSEFFMAMGNPENIQRAELALREYEAQCIELMQFNTDQNYQSQTNTRFKDGGWI